MSCTPTGKVLGQGAYSTVFKLLNEDKKVSLAGKVFKFSETMLIEKMVEKFNKEIAIMVSLRHERIVNCKGVCFLPNSLLPVLVMEKMETTLHDYLLEPVNSNLPVERKLSFLLDTARGLDYLHSQTPAIIHRDLTAKNVLLDSQLRAKIADFGNSRILEFDSGFSGSISMTALPGTLAYMPPEADGSSSSTYDPSLDMFSFGHLSIFTLTQTQVKLLPLTDSSGLHVRSEVDRRRELLNKAEEILSVDHPLLTVIIQCLCNERLKRPSARELVIKIQETLTSSKYHPHITCNDFFAQVQVIIVSNS